MNDQMKTMVELDDAVLFNDGVNVLSVKEDADNYPLEQVVIFQHFVVPNARVQALYI